jgi:hypothetical protein
MQFVYLNIKPLDDIHLETHKNTVKKIITNQRFMMIFLRL